jgi:hypothetical protein
MLKNGLDLKSLIDDVSAETDPTEFIKSDNRAAKATPSERRQKVWEFWIKGIPVSSLAVTFGVDESTIRNDIRELREEYSQGIQSSTGVELVADHLQWLDQLEKSILFDALQADSVIKTIDKRTGVVDRIKSSPEKAKLLLAAIKCREMKIKLHLDTGMIAKEPERLQHTINQATKTDESKIKKEARTPEEIVTSLLELIKDSPVLSSRLLDKAS